MISQEDELTVSNRVNLDTENMKLADRCSLMGAGKGIVVLIH